jgi:hypothetical protein
MMHDPLPLRRQAGMRRYMGQLGGLAKRVERVRIAVHSEPARSAMAELGWQSLPILPMPVLIKSRDDPPLRPQRVSVIGQWKPARDVDLLRQLGPALRARGSEPAITGRHWPDVEGWDVRSAFVSEETIEEELRATTCVVLPYKHFFQSDVAVRALEAQVPVVGPRQPFLEDLFGADWPGLVSSAAPEAWLDAVATVQALPPAVMRERLLAFAARSTEGWTTFLKCSLESGWLS